MHLCDKENGGKANELLDFVYNVIKLGCKVRQFKVLTHIYRENLEFTFPFPPSPKMGISSSSSFKASSNEIKLIYHVNNSPMLPCVLGVVTSNHIECKLASPSFLPFSFPF